MILSSPITPSVTGHCHGGRTHLCPHTATGEGRRGTPRRMSEAGPARGGLWEKSAPLGTHHLAATVHGHPAPVWGPKGAGGRATTPEPSRSVSILLLRAGCACAPGDILWEGLPACSHFLHDVISRGWGAHGRGSAAKCQVPESHGSRVPRAALPTSAGRSLCSRPALGWLVSSREPQVLAGTGWE